ncbi:unnamed protein product, partial [Rotaria magnacalcarata]
VFKLKRTRSYAEEKCSTTDLTGVVNYTVQQARDYRNLIRVPTQSAHSAKKLIILPLNFLPNKY